MVGGEEQVPGVRIQVSESGARSEDDEHPLSAFCFLPSVFCLLLTADCLLHLGSAQVPPTSRLAGPLTSQDRPRIERGDREVACVRGAHA